MTTETPTQINIGLDQFKVRSNDIFVGFETLRGLIDMLRFAGQFSVEYEGGDSFQMNVQPQAATSIVGRFASFGVKAEVLS